MPVGEEITVAGQRCRVVSETPIVGWARREDGSECRYAYTAVVVRDVEPLHIVGNERETGAFREKRT